MDINEFNENKPRISLLSENSTVRMTSTPQTAKNQNKEARKSSGKQLPNPQNFDINSVDSDVENVRKPRKSPRVPRKRKSSEVYKTVDEENSNKDTDFIPEKNQESSYHESFVENPSSDSKSDDSELEQVLKIQCKNYPVKKIKSNSPVSIKKKKKYQDSDSSSGDEFKPGQTLREINHSTKTGATMVTGNCLLYLPPLRYFH